MNIIRNVVFAIASVVTLNLIYWLYTQFLLFLVGIFLNFTLIGLVIAYIVFGGLVFGLAGIIASLLATGYRFICKIGTNNSFIRGWTVFCVIICVIGSCIGFWPTLSLFGAVGIIGAIIITINLIIIGFVLCQSDFFVDEASGTEYLSKTGTV